MPGTDADDEGTGPVPHPLDRPWIHPSELLASSHPTAAATDVHRADADRASAHRADTHGPAAHSARSWRRDLALTVAAGTVGAVATVAVLGLVGTFERDPIRRVATSAPVASSDAASIASRVVPGVAGVITTVAGTERRGSGIAVGTHEILTTTDVVGPSTGSVTGDTAGTNTRTGPIEICLANGRRYLATEIGRDPVTGLVLLAVPTLRVEPARLADTTAVRAGDWIAAVGRTATSGAWVTSGVVTAVDGWMNDDRGGAYAGMITTSTGLAAEARGGALVDRHGYVVGMLSVTGSSPTRTAAIPADMLRDVAAQLAATGTASHGALGLRAIDTADRGATVTEIGTGSSADTAGVRVGDRVTAVDGTATPDTASLVHALRRSRAGAHVVRTIVRGTAPRRLTATLDDAAATIPAVSSPIAVPDADLLAVAAAGRT